MKEIRVKVKIEEMRRLKVGKEDRGEIVWVRLEKKEEKNWFERKRGI